jgi:CubicO group peptidase (beta-lactamase class C family)
LALWLSASAWAQAQGGASGKTPVPKTLEELDKAIEKARVEAGIPAIGVAVIENGAVVLAKGYGHADVVIKQPATDATLFRAGSISKAFVGIAAMMMVEEGKLSLDTPMAALAPEIPVDNPYAKESPIKLVHLLEHTSGWPDYTIKQFAADGRGLTLADAVLKDAPYQSRYEPGRYYAYSNPGAAAAALMVERAAGMPFEDLVWTRIYRPLGMLSATYDKPPRGLATSYRSDGTTPADYMHLSAPAIGGLNVTAKDLAQYPLLMLGRGTLNGTTYLTPESVDRIEQVQSTRAKALGLDQGYGLANFPTMHPKAVFRGHDGGIDGAASQAAYWPGHGAGYAILWTKQAPNPAAEIIRNYLTRNAPAAKAAPAPGETPTLGAYAGTYQAIALRQPLAAPFSTLLESTEVGVAGGKIVIDDKTFTHIGGGRFQREDRPVPTAVFAQEGRDMRLYMPMAALERVDAQVLWQRAAWAIAFAILFFYTLVDVLFWTGGMLSGRLRARGGLGIRLLPLLALCSVAGFAVLASIVFSLDNAVLIPAIGKESAWSLALFAASLMIPILGFLSFWRGLTAGYGADTWVRLIAMAAGGVTLVAALFLHQFGWIGIMTWAR